ncbi:MAG: cytidine deaminase [Gaiellaceae bacterium]
MTSSREITAADEALLEAARGAASDAYAPYSKFLVGAAVRTREGRIITGANVENAAYPLGVCAERTALASAASQGIRPGDIDAAAITASPCGGCRQWLLEFRVERVIFEHDDGVEVHSAAELLPRSFVLDA